MGEVVTLIRTDEQEREHLRDVVLRNVAVLQNLHERAELRDEHGRFTDEEARHILPFIRERTIHMMEWLDRIGRLHPDLKDRDFEQEFPLPE